jgi:undecaprenyl-diphosphatase
VQWLYDLDMNGFRAINVDMHRDWLDPIFLFITISALGGVQTIAALCLLFWKKARVYVLPLLLADLFAGACVADMIKLFVKRDRPSNLAIAIPHEQVFGDTSFPSGHTSTAFGVAFALFFMTRKTERSWMGQVALGWAVLVGISRIYEGVHWPTDVLGGAFAGLVGATGAFLLLSKLGRFPMYEAAEEPVSGIEKP